MSKLPSWIPEVNSSARSLAYDMPRSYYNDMEPSRLARITLDLVNRAPTRGEEAEAVVAVKQFLQQVCSGQLVVGAPVPPKAKRVSTP